MGQGCIHRQRLAPVTDYAAERLDRVGLANLGQIAMAGQAVFHLPGQGRDQRDRPDAVAFLPGNHQEGQ